MTVTKLATHWVEKPWGVETLPGPFGSTGGRRIGEIWLASPDAATPLLVKYLFTREALSIQVHPEDAQAQRLGLSRGKEECWYIIDAEPGAKLWIGTVRPLGPEELRAAALSGEIEALMQWHLARPGLLLHIPPGTVHAIGAGISLIEVQQNSDITYRLYDYGRPRELHLDQGIAVARAEPYSADLVRAVDPGRSGILLECKGFTLAHIAGRDFGALEAAADQMTIIPINETIEIGNISVAPGEAVIVTDCQRWIGSKDARALAAWTRAPFARGQV